MVAEGRTEGSQRDLGDKWQDAIRVKPESQRRWDVIKVVLRTLSLLCAVALVLCAVALVKINGSILHQDALGSFVLSCAVIFWFMAEFITICVQTRRSGLRLTGIPPGAHVAADLLIWTATVIFLGIMTASLIGVLQSPISYHGQFGRQIGIKVAIVGFNIVLTGLHFTLFVRDCMETERRNSEKRIRKAIMSLRQWGLNFAGLNLAGFDHSNRSNNRDQESHELSPVVPESLHNDSLRNEPTERAVTLPATPDQKKAQEEVEMQIEENMKFIMPVSIIREMTGQKYTMMGPADGEQKYPRIRRGER